MRMYLTKNTSFCLLETKQHLLIKKEGRIGGSVDSSTKNCGTEEKAANELMSIVSEYQKKGYAEGVSDQDVELIVFDKAKWHFEGDFPGSLNIQQAYVHTGFYIGWLLKNGLMNEDFVGGNRRDIDAFLNASISPVVIYLEKMDGVFASDDLTVQGLQFTKYYFDFESGKYLTDYENTLANELPTLFHVENTNENFEKISGVIDGRYKDWVQQI